MLTRRVLRSQLKAGVAEKPTGLFSAAINGSIHSLCVALLEEVGTVEPVVRDLIEATRVWVQGELAKLADKQKHLQDEQKRLAQSLVASQNERDESTRREIAAAYDRVKLELGEYTSLQRQFEARCIGQLRDHAAQLEQL